MSGHVARVLTNWMNMVDRYAASLRQPPPLPCGDGEPKPARAHTVRVPSAGVIYDRESGYSRPDPQSEDLENPFHVPFLDIWLPPDEPVRDKVIGYVPVPFADARTLGVLLGLLERCPAASPAEAERTTPEDREEDAQQLGDLWQHRLTLMRESTRHRALYGRPLCCAGRSEFMMRQDKGAGCRRCPHARIKAALCRKAREIMRYREGFAYTDTDVLLESLAADAALAILECLPPDAAEARSALAAVLSADRDTYRALHAVSRRRDRLAGLRAVLLGQPNPDLPAWYAEACAMLEVTAQAWLHLRAGRINETAMCVHAAERCRRLVMIARWAPMASKGMAAWHDEEWTRRRAAEDRIGGGRSVAWMERRDLIWAHHARAYWQAHPNEPWKAVLWDTAQWARDPETGELLGQPGDAAGGATAYAAKTVKNVLARLGISSVNVLTCDLPPIPRLTHASPEMPPPRWLYDPELTVAEIQGYLQGPQSRSGPAGA